MWTQYRCDLGIKARSHRNLFSWFGHSIRKSKTWGHWLCQSCHQHFWLLCCFSNLDNWSMVTHKYGPEDLSSLHNSLCWWKFPFQNNFVDTERWLLAGNFLYWWLPANREPYAQPPKQRLWLGNTDRENMEHSRGFCTWDATVPHENSFHRWPQNLEKSYSHHACVFWAQ